MPSSVAAATGQAAIAAGPATLPVSSNPVLLACPSGPRHARGCRIQHARGPASWRPRGRRFQISLIARHYVQTIRRRRHRCRPSRYIAAIRAAQLRYVGGLHRRLAERPGWPRSRRHLHQRGLHPFKALLQSSEHYEQANHHFAEHGIEVKGVSLKLDTLIGRKNTVVKQNNDGILYLFKKNKVTYFHGKGAFAGQVDGGWSIKVTGTTDADLVAKHVIVATGSSARELPGLPFDERTSCPTMAR